MNIRYVNNGVMAACVVDRGDRGLQIYHRLISCKIVRSLFTLATSGIFPFFLARQPQGVLLDHNKRDKKRHLHKV
jgi:hypothetical protein